MLAARVVAPRLEKLTLTRRQMFSPSYRTPTIQHIEMGADADGRLVVIAHTIEQTARIKEFAEDGVSSRWTAMA